MQFIMRCGNNFSVFLTIINNLLNVNKLLFNSWVSDYRYKNCWTAPDKGNNLIFNSFVITIKFPDKIVDIR
jgi:hypothetical protein